MDDLRLFKDTLVKRAIQTKSLVCIGRTHGQHALPMTYGLKFALWAYEIGDCLKELKESKFYGKMSGAVGTASSFGEKGMEIQARVLEILDLDELLITNQVVSRLFIARYLFNLIAVVSIIDKKLSVLVNDFL